MSNSILETERLFLRKIKTDDYPLISKILKDIEVMYAWEYAFSDSEVNDWINENIMRYERDGYSYWAVIEKSSNKLIGVCGLILEQVDKESYVGIGYIFDKDYWGKGYAFESTLACINYGLNVLKIKEITAQIRPDNISSRKVAEKLGMTVKKKFVKNYNNKEIPHLLYSIKAKL